MERKTPLMLLVSLLIMFSSVVNQAKADPCVDGLGACENCDNRCKFKHGPSSHGDCDRSVGVALCRCYYQCEPPSLTPLNICKGGGGLCSKRCPETCCNKICALNYNGGHGVCNTFGNFNVCQCQYPC
ncbi:hypothetical protein N665_0004s0015 [Sinapis alba]|nr:hypothetical protein N665_0004s0015 [Sinapis alba]